MEKQSIDQPVSLTTADRVPSFEQSGDEQKLLLLIILTDLDEAGAAKLVQHFYEPLKDKVKIQTWAPSRLLLQSIARQGPHKHSRANLYALAVLAYRSGWSRFIVADELTKCQVVGNCHQGKSDMISVVTVATRLNSSATTQKGDAVRVIARRTSGKDEENSKLLETLEDIQTQFITRHKGDIEVSIHGNNGVVLHDPDRSVFTIDTGACLGWEKYTNAVTAALTTSPHSLPTELVTDIIAFNDNDSLRNIKMPLWERRQDRKHLIIFLFFSTTTEEINQTQARIQDAVQKQLQQNDSDTEEMSVELIPLERHHVSSSRRELMMLWWQYRLCNMEEGVRSPTLNFLLQPLQDLDSAQFGTVHCEGKMPPFAVPTTLNRIVRETRGFEGYYVDKLAHLASEKTEIMYDPDEPFLFDSLPWVPAGGDDLESCGVPVFYLTSNLTDKQDQAVRTELKRKDRVDFDGIKECYYVPWKRGDKGQADGTTEDIWEILWKVYVRPDRECDSFVCIDRQSGIDKTVIIVDPDWYFYDEETVIPGPLEHMPAPRIRGFKYTRIAAREAHIMKIGLDVANTDVEDIAGDEGANRFRRPGWPARGILPDESEDEDEDEDEEEDEDEDEDEDEEEDEDEDEDKDEDEDDYEDEDEDEDEVS
jgi:hypothetical protein